MLSSKDSLAVLKKTRALLEGHFVLSSGLHSSKYVQCAKLLSKPSLASNICLSLAKKIRKKGFTIIGLDENSDVMLHNTNDYSNEKKVLVMGSEGKGLRRLTKENCDFLVSIANNNDSDFNTLNVSVSSALALYELMGRDIIK